MTERDQLYYELPSTFSPKQALEKVEELDFEKEWMHSDNWIRSVLDSWLMDKKIERVERGVYRKVKKKRLTRVEKVPKPDHWNV